MILLGSCDFCGILCYIFVCAERVLWLRYIFSACGNFSIIVEFVLYLCVSNTLWYCVISYTSFGTLSDIVEYCVIFSPFGIRSGIFIYFLRVERSLVLSYIILGVERIYGIVEFCVIFFCVWNTLCYCGMLCYNFLRVECSLVLWNLILYIPACGTCSDIVESRLIFPACGMCSGIA